MRTRGILPRLPPRRRCWCARPAPLSDRQTRQSGSPPVLDVTGLGGVEVRTKQRLVLTDSHLSATDADTVLSPGVVDPCEDHVSHQRHYGRKTSASFVLERVGGYGAGDR